MIMALVIEECEQKLDHPTRIKGNILICYSTACTDEEYQYSVSGPQVTAQTWEP